jgi:hypothetical protein
MGNFSLAKKKVNDNIVEISTNPKNTVTVFKFGFPQRRTSQDPNLRSSQNASAKPVLSIKTNVVNNLTPPLTPSESPRSGKRGSHNWAPERRASTPSIRRFTPGTTPPQSPISKTPDAKPQNRTRFTSLTLFRTPRQRKLQEIREGKLPAIIDPEFRRTSISSATSIDTDSIPTEICDPSSSTTYNRRTISKKHSENGTSRPKVVKTLSSTLTTMQMSF